MGIYYNKKSRRQFLVGSGKTLLALPLLPSLLPRTAWGQSNAPDDDSKNENDDDTIVLGHRYIPNGRKGP